MALPAEDLDPQTRLWCAGLPLESTRELSELERRYLRLAAWCELGVFTLLSIATLAWTAGVLVLGAVMDRADRLTPGLGIMVFFVWILALAVQLASANDAFRGWRWRMRDLRSGELLCFEGTLRPEDGLRHEQRQLIELGFLRRGRGEAQRLLVLSGSRQVWMRNARGQNLFATVWVHQVAAMPEYAYRVPVSPAQLRVVSHPDLRFRKRVLSEAELKELRDYVGRLRRLDPGQWFAAALLVMLIAELLGVNGRPATTLVLLERIARDLLFLTVVVMAANRYWNRLKFAAGLVRDAAIGWALSVDPECAASPQTPAPDGPGRDADPDLAPEFLAHSGALWIHHGKPAPWRVLRRAA